MRYLLVLFCLLVCSAVSAQNAKIDSLKKVIATTKVDTIKGRSLCRLCRELGLINENDNAISFVGKGIEVLAKNQDFEGQVNCYSSLILTYRQKGEYQRSLDCFNKFYNIAKLQKLNPEIFQPLHIQAGNTYFAMGDFYKALTSYQTALKLQSSKGNEIKKLQILNNIGNAYTMLGDYSKALGYFLQSMKLSERSNNQEAISALYSNIGSIYHFKGEYQTALDYHYKSLKIEEQIGNNPGIASTMISIGNAYCKMSDIPKALDYLQKGLDLYKKINDLYGTAMAIGNIGIAYEVDSNFLAALDQHKRQFEISQQLEDQAGMVTSLFNIANMYFHLRETKEAKNYCLKGLKLLDKVNGFEYYKEGHKISYLVDSALGDYKSAFEHHKLYKQYSDSLNNEDKAKEFGRIESKFQFEKEAEEAKRKQEAQAKVEAEATTRRDNLQYLTIFAGIIGLFAGLVFMGKFRIPVRVLDVAIFAGLLILFEFLLILFDPLFEKYSGGIPFYKLGFNTVVAFAFAPLHEFLEGKLKKRLVKG